MADHAVSQDAAVQQQLDRLAALSPGVDTLGLERIGALLARLGNPERSLPPVFHVAGTNGKGSVCAFLRAALEAAGLSAHVYTSPHLVRFNERIRIGGTLIADGLLAELLEEVLDQAHGIEPSFFEATTAAAFLAFSRIPADAAVIEVGLGGGLDATNVIPSPAICGIAQLGIDHQFFLGSRLDGIAAEKAGIAKRGVRLVTQHYPARLASRIVETAAAAGAEWLPRGGEWDASVNRRSLHYSDAMGKLDLPVPRLHGAHQAGNAALAAAMLRHQNAVKVPDSAIRAAMGWADWPARLQRLGAGPLHDLLPHGAELWLDGGHNPAAARAVAAFFRTNVPPGRPFQIVLGLLSNKDAAGVLKPFAKSGAMIHGVPVSGHEHHSPAALAAVARELGLHSSAATGVTQALTGIAASKASRPPVVLILGSLYLAGQILQENGQEPG